MSTLAGTVGLGGSSNTAPGTFQFSNPAGVAVDSSGNVFVADTLSHVIRKITISGGTVTLSTFAGTVSTQGNADGDGSAARFNGPRGLAIDGANNLYVADAGNHAIRRITSTGTVSTLAGTAGTGATVTPGYVNDTGQAARFNAPLGIFADRGPSGTGAAVNVYVADTSNNAIRQIVVSSGVVTTVAGPVAPAATSGNTNNSDNIGTNARFFGPTGIAGTAASGATATLWVTDRVNNLIRQISISGTNVNVSTLAGSGGAGYAEGTGTGATFNSPTGITVASASTLYVSDTNNQVIRSIAITGTPGATALYAGAAGIQESTDGTTANARFRFPTGIASNGTTTFVVDTTNQTIRAIGAATAPTVTSPSNATAAVGGNAQFTVTATGTPSLTYQWQSSTDSGSNWGNLTNGVSGASGVTTNQLTLSNVQLSQNNMQLRVTVSNGISSVTSTTPAVLTVTPAPAAPQITSATSTTWVLGQSNTFKFVATGTPAPDITNTGGNYPSGLLNPLASYTTTTIKTANQTEVTVTATPTDNNAGVPYQFQITATNGQGTPATQNFTLTIATTAPAQLTTVASQTVPSGGSSALFSVVASGSPTDFTYQWQRSIDGGFSWNALTDGVIIDGATYSGSTGSNLSITGITPLMNTNQYRVVVKNNGGTTSQTSNGALLNVAPLITTPTSFTLTPNQSASPFTVQALGNPSPAISITGSTPNGVVISGSSILGSPIDVTSGSYPLVITATNSGGTTVQNFTLIISPPQAPFITSAANATFNIGQPVHFTFTAAGAPSPSISVSGIMPNGVVFVPPTLTGTPLSAEGSPYTLTVQASNASGTVTQTFMLTVLGTAPIITQHPVSATINAGGTVTFNAAVAGTPTPTLHWQRQPNGTNGFVNLTDDGTFSGTGTTTLTITNATAALGLDQFRLVANNGTGGDIPSSPATLTVTVGTVLATIAGSPGVSGGVDGVGTTARFNAPSGIAIDFGGNVYVADTANHVIRKMTSGGVVSTLAGLANFAGNTDGAGSNARFNSPQGVGVDGAGNVYVADTLNHTIRVISPSGTVTTLAGLAGNVGILDGQGANARFNSPAGITVDIVGNVYVADTGNHTIRKILPGGFVSTYAGTPGQSGSFDSSVATSARFNGPIGLTLDLSGNLYVADSINQVIRRISPGGTTGGNVAVVAGLFNSAGTNDGNGTVARFNRPVGVAYDNTSASVYVADMLNSTIRKIASNGDVTTVAGLALLTGSVDGAGTNARLFQPQGVAVDFSGNLYVADTRNYTIRRTGSPTAAQILSHPVNRTASVGQSVSFTVTATGSPPPGYQWQRQVAGGFGFVNLVNDATYSGVSTATLTISAATQVMNGDQFRVVTNNGVTSPPTSNAATLSVGAAPVFTSPTTATFRAQEAGSFTVAVTSDTTVTYTSPNLPSWATLSASTGAITGTPPDTTGSPFTVTINANNGITATQTLTITVTPAVFPPSVATQPVGATVNQGENATFSVVAGGTQPFTYQWRKDGVAIPGAVSSSLTIANAQPSAIGLYSVVITNSVGNITSNVVSLVVNSPAAITTQPHAEIATAGSTVTFSVAATGGGVSYQWRRNGSAIPGATNPSLTLPSVSAADAANYDVVVSNGLGVVISSLAQLTIATGPVAPVITAQPVSRTVLAGRATTLSVSATGVPAPSYQWRKNGANIAGAVNSSFAIGTVGAGDEGTYDVIVTSTAGTVNSNGAILRVISRSYAGYYFGTFSGAQGNFALYVREDNTGVFLGYLPGSTAPVMNLNVFVGEGGTFTFSQSTILSDSSNDGPARAAALGGVAVNGTIANDGSISGSMSGGASATLAATRTADVGSTQSVAGFFQAGATTSGATIYTIAGPGGQALVVAQSGSVFDGGLATVTSGGAVSISTGRSTINESLATNGTVSGSSTGAINVTAFNGANDSVLARQRLLNISSRARVAAADAVAIAGFVISGEESKPVLIRAVGPTLATLQVTGALTTPRLELFRGTTSLAVNTGIGTNRAAIDAAGTQAGAFPLGSAGTDAAILTTLAPGAYTAVVGSSTTAAGIALVEVYDLSSPAAGQKLLNIATRASAGTAEAVLTAGFVVPPGAAKRVLIRGIGPGLASFGVTGVLATPVLTLLNASNTAITSNTNYLNSTDRADIVTASAQVGGFGLTSGDSAMIVTLPAGNYTAQVVGTNNTTGIALIEVYELP